MSALQIEVRIKLLLFLFLNQIMSDFGVQKNRLNFGVQKNHLIRSVLLIAQIRHV